MIININDIAVGLFYLNKVSYLAGVGLRLCIFQSGGFSSIVVSGSGWFCAVSFL